MGMASRAPFPTRRAPGVRRAPAVERRAGTQAVRRVQPGPRPGRARRRPPTGQTVGVASARERAAPARPARPGLPARLALLAPVATPGPARRAAPPPVGDRVRHGDLRTALRGAALAAHPGGGRGTGAQEATAAAREAGRLVRLRRRPWARNWRRR